MVPSSNRTGRKPLKLVMPGSSPAGITTTSEEVSTVPFPPRGENCTTLTPSSFPNRTHFIGLRFGFHQGANTVPFPPHGENCTMLAPSSFSESNPLRWASIRVFNVISRRRRRPIDRCCCFSFPNRTHFIGLRFGSHQGANTVPFPPCGENCTMLAPSSFSESNPLCWISIRFLFRAVGEKEILWNAFGNTPGNGSIRSGSRDMFNRLIWHRMR